MATEHQVRAFVDRFRSFQQGLAASRFRETKEKYDLISSHINHVKNKHRELALFDPKMFNIFSILRLDRREVRTHSAFLANLLDPNGTHGQGTLFLREMFSMLAHSTILENVEIDQNDWSVETERITWFGNLDILIYSFINKSCIIIENKIDAIDQDGQLARYSRWLEVSNFEKGKSRLVYLTIDGKNPSDYSLRYGNKEISLSEITLMSYKKTPADNTISIAGLLENCIPEIKAHSVAIIVQQYIDTITNL